MTGENDAVELLYRNLGALPHPDLGTLNLLPFAQQNPQTQMLTHAVSEAVVQLFRDHGYPMAKNDVTATRAVSRDIVLQCRSCSSALLHTHVDDKGVANVPAASVIAGIAALNHECPHNPITPADQRRKIEEAVLAQQADGSV